MNAYRPSDPQDIKNLESYRVEGEYSYNERGYLVCTFENIFLQFTGMEPGRAGMIAFHVFDSRFSRQWGEIYTRV